MDIIVVRMIWFGLGCSKGRGEKWLDSKNFLTVELTIFAGRIIFRRNKRNSG